MLFFFLPSFSLGALGKLSKWTPSEPENAQSSIFIFFFFLNVLITPLYIRAVSDVLRQPDLDALWFVEEYL